MLVYGQLEKAQLENTTSDSGVTALIKGIVTFRTDLNVMKVANGTAHLALIDESTAQSFSNKTITGAIFTDPLTLNYSTTPANPAAGSVKLYFKNDNRLYKKTSAGVEEELAGFKNTVTSSLSLSASAALTINTAEKFQSFYVSGTGGETTLSTTPFGATPPADGSIIALIGADDDNPVIIPFADVANGCYMDGNVTLAKGQTKMFMWINALTRYVRL